MVRHGRATSETFERDFSRNGSKQDRQKKSDSDTCHARPCQKVAWSCQTPSSLNTSFKLICKGVGSSW
ncbi:hypothetical protein Hanom_Chr12g01114461 [Helianthus anomalus]